MRAAEVGQRLGAVSQGGDRSTSPSPQTPSQGLGCSGLNACQGSSCLLRWELTHPRSLLTPLSHMLLPGAFQGRVEVSAEACERAGCGMPSCPARSPPAAGTTASPLAAHRGFYEPELARSPVGKHKRGPGDGNLPLTPRLGFLSPPEICLR